MHVSVFRLMYLGTEEEFLEWLSGENVSPTHFTYNKQGTVILWPFLALSLWRSWMRHSKNVRRWPSSGDSVTQENSE